MDTGRKRKDPDYSSSIRTNFERLNQQDRQTIKEIFNRFLKRQPHL